MPTFFADSVTHNTFLKTDRVTEPFLKFDRTTAPFVSIEMRRGDRVQEPIGSAPYDHKIRGEIKYNQHYCIYRGGGGIYNHLFNPDMVM